MLDFFVLIFFLIRSKSEPWLQLTRSSRWTGGQVEPEEPGIWFGLMEGKCIMARLKGSLS